MKEGEVVEEVVQRVRLPCGVSVVGGIGRGVGRVWRGRRVSIVMSFIRSVWLLSACGREDVNEEKRGKGEMSGKGDGVE